MATQAQIRGHFPITISNFMGLFSRGMDDSVPFGYFRDCLNVSFGQSEVKTRPGSSKSFSVNNIRRLALYKRLLETSRYLILTTSGDFIDSLYPSTPLLSDATLTDFSVVNINNRAYITFHDRTRGISGKFVYVYQGGGPGTIRLAAGSSPTGFTLNVTESMTSGTIDAGTRLIAVAFESDSGFISAPGPAIFATYTTTNTDTAIDIANIPIGPAGTVARRILISHATQSYDGNQFGQELFFALRIPNNIDTTYTGLSFFDNDLTASADYLLDIVPQIPCGVGVATYGNRMVVWGVPGFEYYVFFSTVGQPEVFDLTAGVLLVDPSDAITPVTNCIEYRKSFYIMTDNRTLVTVDNGNDPNTWSCDSVDKGLGTKVFGISNILDARGANIDRFFMGSRAGLYAFESSSFIKPEFSYNIKNLWKRINQAHFDKVQVTHDPDNFLVYVSVPLDSATECSHILVADYSNAIIPPGYIVAQKVKWSMWNYSNDVMSITVDLNTDGDTTLIVGRTNNIYIHDDGDFNDDGIAINSLIETHLFQVAEGAEHHYGFFAARIIGSGTAVISRISMDRSLVSTVTSFTLATTPDKPCQSSGNFTATKASTKVSCNNGWFEIYSLSNDVKPIWFELPN